MTALASSRNDRHEAPPNSLCRDITGVMLTVACKPVRYQVFAAEEGRWSPTNDLVLNYKGINRQQSELTAGCQETALLPYSGAADT